MVNSNVKKMLRINDCIADSVVLLVTQDVTNGEKKPRSTYTQSVSCVSRSVEAIKSKPRFVVALVIQQYSRTF